MWFQLSVPEKIGDKTNNKHKQLFGIVPGTGGGQVCLCVACLWDPEKETHNVPRKSQENAGTVLGQSRDAFRCLLAFLALENGSGDSSSAFGS